MNKLVLHLTTGESNRPGGGGTAVFHDKLGSLKCRTALGKSRDLLALPLGGLEGKWEEWIIGMGPGMRLFHIRQGADNGKKGFST